MARELNFTRAAEACNVTQPALTRAIQSLEGELGGALFHRERAQTHLSELGRMMLPYLQTIHAQAEAARAEAKNAKGMQSVRMKLGAMCTLSPSIMSDFIVGFQRKNEGVNVHVRDGNAQTLVQKLSAGDMEIGVLAFPEALDDRFHVMPLFQERFVCVLPKEHPLAAKNAVTAQDLDNQPYVNRVACEYIDFAAQQFAALGVNIRIVFRSERDDWVLSMVRAGLGWAFYPEFSPIPDDVVVRPLVEPEFVRTVSLVTVRGRPHSPAVGAFVRAARAHQWPRLDQGSSIAA